MFEHPFPTATYSFGDLLFDKTPYDVFKAMVVRRFGDSQSGYKTEIRLKAFYALQKPHPLSFIPFVGFLTIGADMEYHGILKVDVALLDSNDKYIFHKTYEIDIREMKGAEVVIKDAVMDMHMKSFNRFGEEFERDMGRINFDTVGQK